MLEVETFQLQRSKLFNIICSGVASERLILRDEEEYESG